MMEERMKIGFNILKGPVNRRLDGGEPPMEETSEDPLAPRPLILTLPQYTFTANDAQLSVRERIIGGGSRIVAEQVEGVRKNSNG
jgi:hypothetical protein